MARSFACSGILPAGRASASQNPVSGAELPRRRVSNTAQCGVTPDLADDQNDYSGNHEQEEDRQGIQRTFRPERVHIQGSKLDIGTGGQHA